MSIVGALVTFSILWWLFFFMALPFGVRPPDETVAGTDPGAPEKPRILLKAAVATALAAAATSGVAWIIDSGLIQLRP